MLVMQAALLVAAGLVVYNLFRPKTIQCKKKCNQPMESIWPLPQRESELLDERPTGSNVKQILSQTKSNRSQYLKQLVDSNPGVDLVKDHID